MTDRLLPPDPSKDGWYWVFVDEANIAAMRWRRHGFWGDPPRGMTAKDAAYFGYRLASPHPIPTPEQLNALHQLIPDMTRESEECWETAYQDAEYGWVSGVDYGIKRIRTALGAKP